MVSRDVRLVGVVVAVAVLQLVCVYLYFGPSSPEERALPTVAEEKPSNANHLSGRGSGSGLGSRGAGLVKEIPRVREVQDGADYLDGVEQQPVLEISGNTGNHVHSGQVVDIRKYAFQRSQEAIELLQGAVMGESTTGSRSVKRLIKKDAEILPVCLFNRLPEETPFVAMGKDPITGQELQFAHFGPDVSGYGEELRDWGMAEPNKFATGMRMLSFYAAKEHPVVYIDTGATLGFLSLWFAEAGAEVYAFEPLHRHAWKICISILLNGLQDKVALFNVAPYAVDEEQAWCTPKSHFGLRYAEISCPQSTLDKWFGDYEYELFRLRDADFLFRDTLGHVFDQYPGSVSIIIRVVFDYAEEFLRRVEKLLEADRNVKHIWVSSNLETWKSLDGVQFVHDMRAKGFFLVDEFCQEFLEPNVRTLKQVNEFLFTREPLACGLDPAILRVQKQQ